MDIHDFERARLALFAAHGFEATGERFTAADGRTTAAVVGTRPGRTVIAIHGGLADASMWASVAAHLPGRVVIPDRPGHGLSDDVDYTGVDYRAAAAAWVRGLVDALGEPEVDLVGNSMGGYFAIAFASAYPARVRRLALVGAPAGLDRPLPLLLRLWGRRGIGHLIARMSITDPEVMRTRVMADLVAHPERLTAEMLRVAMMAGSRPGFGRMVHTMLRAVTDLGGWRRAMSIREVTAALAMPTLFTWGDRDSFAPIASGREVAGRMRDARVDEIAEAGHLPQLDQPEAVGASVREFLADGAVPTHRTPAPDVRPRS